ncbi:MAG: sulfite exporter TauE/SafE family protein [Oscillospiraceae bacterium]|nr:sulfite exporter TauE/SafE family protein [Oscillospiraceae bacterium]
MIYAAAFLTGFLSSLGVGGGVILIVYLTVIAGVDQLTAQGINLIFFLPIALLSVIIHRKNKLVDIKQLIPAMIVGSIFSVVGAFAAELIGGELLRKGYGIFVMILGVRSLFQRSKKKCSAG